MQQLVTHFETDTYRVYPGADSAYTEESSLDYVSLATAEGLEDHITLTDGRFPEPASLEPGSAMEVLVADEFATEVGLQVGDSLIVYNFRDENPPVRELPVTVAGTWTPTDPEGDYWFFPPTALDNRFFVPEATFATRVVNDIALPVQRGVWFLVMDGTPVTTEDVGQLSGNAAYVLRQAENLLPGIRNPITPVDGFESYRRAVGELTVLLAAFNIPVLALVLAFIILIVGLAVEQRRNEIAVMRSRGATPWQIVGFALVEGIVLGLIAFALGTLLALALTQFMGKTRSFLDFSADYTLRVALNEAGLRAGVLAVGLAIVAQVVPTLAASRDTIISYKQVQARTVGRPWWQRAWIDLLLLGVTLYGFYLLRQQGSIQTLGAGAAGGDPLENPLLFLLPFLAVFSLTLLFLRIFPWIMEGLSWLLNKSDSVGLLLGTRQLARTPRAYAMPLILLVLTVSLATFTASLAQTLDLQLLDAAFYRTGADVQLSGAGVDFSPPNPFGGNDERDGGIYLPMDEYLDFPDVQAATRVGRYPAETVVSGDRVSGVYLGVDRASFGATGFWRYDFAQYRLGSLLNALAAVPDGLLVSRDFMAANGLRPGDLFRLTVNAADGTAELDAQIVGALDYFPTWYAAEDGPLFVGNLETLFAQTGGEMPYEVWLSTGGPVDETAMRQRAE